MRAVPFSAVVWIIFLPWTHVDSAGVSYAVISGAIASGLGYVIWYSVLPGLKAASAATVQLSVPVLAAAGGILLLGEPITLRYCFRFGCSARRNRTRYMGTDSRQTHMI